MSDLDLKDLADYHTEIWHERNGWVATERSVTPSVQLFKIGYVLGMEKLKEYLDANYDIIVIDIYYFSKNLLNLAIKKKN
jgi:hypothetical protein